MDGKEQQNAGKLECWWRSRQVAGRASLPVVISLRGDILSRRRSKGGPFDRSRAWMGGFRLRRPSAAGQQRWIRPPSLPPLHSFALRGGSAGASLSGV